MLVNMNRYQVSNGFGDFLRVEIRKNIIRNLLQNLDLGVVFAVEIQAVFGQGVLCPVDNHRVNAHITRAITKKTADEIATPTRMPTEIIRFIVSPCEKLSQNPISFPFYTLNRMLSMLPSWTT